MAGRPAVNGTESSNGAQRRLAEIADDLCGVPTLTVYLDTSPMIHRAREPWAVALRYLMDAARAELPPHGPERRAFERAAARLEMRVRGLRHVRDAQGWVMFIANGDVRLSMPLPFAVPTAARWQVGAWLAPVTSLADREESPELPTRKSNQLLARTIELGAVQ